MNILTVEQMAEIDNRTMKDYGISRGVLMENAGKAAAERAAARAEKLGIRRIIVICGRGNNGGDGFVCARYLDNRGFAVKAFLSGRKRDVRGDAKKALDSTAKTVPVAEISYSSLSRLKSEISRPCVLVDALLGTGLKGPLKSPVSDIIEAVSSSGNPVIAIDIPSGLDGDNGSVQTACAKSVETVSMGFCKLGVFLNRGPELAGEVNAADIGIPRPLAAKTRPAAILLEKGDAAALLPPRPLDAHKGSMGSAFILGGSCGYTGAVILTAKAALRSGCGLACVGAPRTLNPVLEAALAESISRPLPETESITLGLEAEEPVLSALENYDVLAVGPGLGIHPETAALVQKLVIKSPRPLVIDADAINSLRGDPSILDGRQSPAVLTPHPGELSALTGKTVGEILLDPLKIIGGLATRHGLTVILKQPKTLIAAPDGSIFINPTGNPGMATAGSGDVLTGIIAGFIARGMDVLEAAKLGVYLHGLAGDIAAERMTGESMIAGDITESLPGAFRKLSGS